MNLNKIVENASKMEPDSTVLIDGILYKAVPVEKAKYIYEVSRDTPYDINMHVHLVAIVFGEKVFSLIHTQYLLANGLKECPICKKKYSGNGKFCSAECEQKQKASEPHAMRVCEVCGKEFSCPVSDMIHPLCSDNCRSIFRDNAKKVKEQKKTAFHAKQQTKQLSKEEKYIEENGLCSICRTSYKDCERLQSNFTASPKGSVFSGSIVVKCPKFRK